MHTLVGRTTAERYYILYSSSFCDVLKSKAFVFGGVQKDLDSKHLLRYFTSSSRSLPYLITPLSMQALAESVSYDQYFLLRCTRVFSLVMWICLPQYADRVCCESPSSYIIFYDVFVLSVITKMNHCILF